ncbi:carbohydrate ABC transporter permease [Paenibacillus radicis (ex Gao et al. 2016)]|uniref:Protein LplC n=1 Tax=Paenibacillus radicis (ex Gao et al. 2016) TaxID=1737354 RepID=A0A917HHT8_9BACL|nr:carbohydrate ABC transporter permease [Paenibacillus radicis (ex Gao et al. 2016)]GGG79041.1 protein LplC [Paenibacillus radicis (ex Gao et al. 2016)]
MFRKATMGRKVFVVGNYAILIGAALICLLPIINILAISFSSSSAVGSGRVQFWPVEFTLKSYAFVLEKPEFMTSFIIAVKRVLVGVPINMLLTILIAYPLSKEKQQFKWRGVYVWFFVITMLFSGGLIPWYLTIKATGLIDSFWALIIPGAVPIFNVILLLNFFRSLPKEIEEAAFMDGATQWKVLWKIFVPLSAPAIATLVLFCIVTHWNSWFEGLMLMNDPSHYPLQSYLQTVIVNRDMSLATSTDWKALALVSDRTTKAAQVFVATVPVLCVYPFLQKYFTEGIVMGSVKG